MFSISWSYSSVCSNGSSYLLSCSYWHNITYSTLSRSHVGNMAERRTRVHGSSLATTIVVITVTAFMYMIFSSMCRQVVIDMDGGQQIVNSPTVNVTVTISGDHNTVASIVSSYQIW